VARITRKELKTDKFALEVEHTVDFFEEHRTEIFRYGAIALAVAAIVVAILWYRNHQQTIRENALTHALAVQAAPVGPAPPGAPITFPTQAAKDQEIAKVFSALAAKYPGTDEGVIAEFYLACMSADEGKLADAEKRFEDVAHSGNQRYASLAKLSLGQVYFADGKPAEGEKTLRSLMDHPSIFVSKDEAALTLARALVHTKPDEARKLLIPLRATHGPASEAAIQVFAELPPK
jgi:predicted negative regulator of RcsB-dependent stress response